MRRRQVRAALAPLVEEFGLEAVQEALRDIEANPRTRRKRGRPLGAKYDDTRLLQAAAAHWRHTGCGVVWPSLVDVGGGEAAAYRLLRRLDEWNADGCAERGIADLYAALCRCRDARAAAKFQARVVTAVQWEAVRAGRLVTPQEAHGLTAPFIGEIAHGLGRHEEVRLGFGVFYPTANGGVGFRSG